MTDKPLILVVDDEKLTSRTVTMALEAVGYQAMVAEDGKTGLEQALAVHPQLIVLDYHLKGMDGVEVLRKLRTDSWGKDVPVIMASNVYDVDLINTLMELNVPDYVLKSDVNLDDIIKLVGKYVPVSAVQTGSGQ
jgi:DNA-binding response OmpR family regulator